MPPMVRAAYWLQYAGPRLAVSLMLGMGDPMLRGLSKLVGRIAYKVDGRHRPRALEHLEAAGYSPHRSRQIARRMFEHMASSIIEGMVLRRRIANDNWDKYVRLEGREILDEALKAGKGVLFVGCHQGSWELAGIVMNLLGYPLTSIARPFSNPYVDEFLNSARGATGGKIVKQSGGLRELMRDLKRGRIGVILSDQNAGSRRGVRAVLRKARIRLADPRGDRAEDRLPDPALLHLPRGALALRFRMPPRTSARGDRGHGRRREVDHRLVHRAVRTLHPRAPRAVALGPPPLAQPATRRAEAAGGGKAVSSQMRSSPRKIA